VSFLEVKDISNNKNKIEREGHCSQFLYHLYKLKKSEFIKIDFIPNYKDKISISFSVK
jgi:hypothetical protein